MADITATLQAKSNQLNAADLIGGPITVAIERVDVLSLIHISEPTRRLRGSRMPSSA